MLCGLPEWVMRWAAEASLFIEYERQQVPARILEHLVAATSQSASQQEQQSNAALPTMPSSSKAEVSGAVTLANSGVSSGSEEKSTNAIAPATSAQQTQLQTTSTPSQDDLAAAAAEAYDLKQHRMQTLAIT